MKRLILLLGFASIVFALLGFIFMWPPFMWPLVPNPHICRNNLREILTAKEEWALAHGARPGDSVVVSEVDSFFKDKTTPKCPSGGTYIYNALGVDPECSHFKDAWTPKKQRVSLFRFAYDDENDPSRHTLPK
jgi:hypothetical protein